ncbi:hypothetical protein JCM10207_000915 [Rhodosporidiobolus poonsookiae]
MNAASAKLQSHSTPTGATPTTAAPPAATPDAPATRRRPAPVAAQSSLPPASSSTSAPPPSTPAAAVKAQLLPPVPATSATALPPMPPLPKATVVPANYRPASMKPPVTRVPTFPLVDAYVPDATSNDRRHPRQLVPKDLGFPTHAMGGKIRKEDLDDRLLMATCAVLHGFENRALCPKEVAEVMLERDWLKNAGTTPFAHVSTCIRSHISRAAGANPPYLPLLTPFELVGALTAEEVRAVGLHAEQRPAVKRGTLWYLNPQVFGPGIGADDPFVRCRREAGLAPSDRDGLYVRGLVPLQPSQPSISPALNMSSAIFHSNGADDGEGDEEGMGRGKRKRRASSAMMAAMSTTPAGPSPLSTSVGPGTPTPVPIAAAAPRPIVGSAPRRPPGFAPSSAPVRSSIPKLKLRLTALEEHDSGVDDSDGHVGEAAERRRKNKKKVRRAGSEGLSRTGSVESTPFDSDDEDLSASFSRPSAFSSASSSALLAQSLLAASSPAALPRSHSSSIIDPHHAVSPDILSLANPPTSFPFSRPTTQALNLSISAPNIFSHHFTSTPDVMDLDAPSPDAGSSTPAGPPPAAASPASDHHTTTDEDDFHEAMLHGDDLLDFEWGSESYTSTAGTSSIEASASLGPVAGAAAGAVADGKSRPVPRPLTPLTPASSLPELDDTAVVEAALRKKADEQHPPQGADDTPATTPRSPEVKDSEADAAVDGDGDETLEVEVGEKDVEEVKAEDDAVEIVQGPLGAISRVGMSTTLCGEMTAPNSDGEDDDGVIIVVEDEEVDVASASQANVSLTSLVHDTPPSVKHSPRPDSGHLTAPPPSPLPLEFTSMGALTNAFAATDFDFVGHDEAERSPFFVGGFAPFHTHDGDSADDEDEDDDIITVKVEEEDGFEHSSAPPSRASSAYPPASTFDTRLLAGVRASSTTSSSSDSDSFDPMTFVSAPMLASGLPVPQPAPSPPETTDWSLNIDMLEDLEGELAPGVDLMGPELIGLEELDLAWAGDDEDAPSPSASASAAAVPARLVIPRSNAFLTGSSHRFTSPIPSPRRSSSTRVPTLADIGKKGTAAPTLTRTSSASTVFCRLSTVTPKPSSAAIIESSTPLDPVVVSTVVQRGVVVFSVQVVDAATSQPIPLLRRLDTDYCNATVLLRAALASPADISAALSSLPASADETFHVSSSTEPGLEGTWVPLPTARELVAAHAAQLAHLAIFVEDDLAVRFPEPVPTMRAGLLGALPSIAKDPRAHVLGTQPFDGAEVGLGSLSASSADEHDDDEDEARDGVGAAEPSTPPPPRRTGRSRRPSAAAVKADLDSPTSASPRKSRRAAK